MAGTIIADYIRTDANKLSLNVGNVTFATINSAGFHSNTGVQIIDQNGQINAASIAAGSIPVGKLGAASVSRTNMYTGAVLQVVNVAYATGTSTTSTSFVDTGLTATITPTSSTSKILVCVAQTLSSTTSGSNTYGAWRVLRDATQIYTDPRTNMYMQYAHGTYTCFVLDTPATTSATTYKTQMYTGAAIYTLEAQHASLRTSTITLLEIAG
jgi:hypothetical protein